MSSGTGGGSAGSWGIIFLAVVVVAILGGFAFLHPDSELSAGIIGALIPIASGVGFYFFHASSVDSTSNFLGQQSATIQGILGTTGTVTPSAAPVAVPPSSASASVAPAASPATDTPAVAVSPGGVA